MHTRTAVVLLALGLTIVWALWQMGLFRLVLTAYLIQQTEPYEQSGTGAGRILVLGDSTGYGTGVYSPEESFAGLLGQLAPGYAIENNSVNGRTIADVRPVAEAVVGNYDLIVLQIGGNDVLQKRDVRDARADMEVVLDSLRDNTTHIVWLSTGNVGAARAFSGREAAEYEAMSRIYRNAWRELTRREARITYVDLFLPLEEDPFQREPERYLALDGLHPSAAGYAYWFAEARPILCEILEVEQCTDS